MEKCRPEAREKVYELIDGEIEYAEWWDASRPTGSQPDSEKSVETWLLWMETYLSMARFQATKSFSKVKALENVRKVAGLAVNCMTYHETPPRKDEK